MMLNSGTLQIGSSISNIYVQNSLMTHVKIFALSILAVKKNAFLAVCLYCVVITTLKSYLEKHNARLALVSFGLRNDLESLMCMVYHEVYISLTCKALWCGSSANN